MADVFISYASQDRERAKLLADALEHDGISVWWDRDIVAGDTYDLIIERELEAATAVVVLWTRASIVSDWVKSEAHEAAEHGTLVPALIDPVKPPLEFRRTQTADLADWSGDPAHPGFLALKRGLLAHRAPSQAAPPPATAPPPMGRPEIVATAAAIEKRPADEPRRRTIRRHVWLIGALLVAAAAIGAWDALLRQHVTYFANVAT